MSKPDLPDVFDYRNYRKFLVDYFAARKASEYGYSYRRFARDAGLSSPNYLKLVSEGARNLSPEMAGRFAAACGLRAEAADYFCDLVAFNQATGPDDRQRCQQRLKRYRRYREVFRLDEAHAAYHGKWYIPAVRELVTLPDFRAEPGWIARRLRPRITPRQARRALQVLEELGMVAEQEGRLVQSDALVSTGEGPLGHHIVSFHLAMLERAGAALQELKTDERSFGGLTLSLSRAQMQRLQERLYDFRQELLQESPSGEEPPELVAQLNFQLFPLTTDGDPDAQ
ncbi:MAG: TIGR02147 family protein [Myxococcales bacterium]|nr:TIGR02147 family protein [Myxococcales bacterium]